MLWKQACAHTEHTASPADRRLRMLLESFCVGNIVGAQKAGSAFVVLRALVLFPLVLRAAAQGANDGAPFAPGTFKPAAGNAACLWCGHGGSGETGAGAAAAAPASFGSGGGPVGAGDPRADYERRCLERHGVHAEYDDEFAVCMCAEGYGPDQSEQCVIDLVQVMTWLWQQACASSQHAAVHRVPGYYRRFAR